MPTIYLNDFHKFIAPTHFIIQPAHITKQRQQISQFFAEQILFPHNSFVAEP